ncbi:ATP-binding protein [Paenibacillus sp. J5C_2022]|uniref:hybrid sensor histidine kinase/response regulator n=1 Tax=Paenibacillus sp. J5C2022 TaxID=2977129 RepID=UPI0021D07527|nr:ATP-binding protein [Paenibacillus sp. J5C2022]MCU6709915.1 ATP-binding protein [Paenibacillus sp. J5C2022]
MRTIQKRYRQISTLAVVLFTLSGMLLLLMQIQPTDERNAPPRAERGVLDLTKRDFHRDGTAVLNGEWEFYWKRLLPGSDFGRPNPPEPTGYADMPGVWDKYRLKGSPLPGYGYATYRLKVKTGGNIGPLTLYIPVITTAYKMMIDGRTVAEGGKVAESKAEAYAAYVPQSVTFQPVASEFDIVLQVSNYYYPNGGIWYEMQLGTPDRVAAARAGDVAWDMIFFGSTFMIGVYHLVIYVLRRRQRSALYFGLICLLISFRVPAVRDVLILGSFPSTDIGLLTFMEYFSYYGAITFATMYRRELFPEQYADKIIKPLVWICVGFMATIVLFPAEIYTEWIGLFHYVAFMSVSYQVIGIAVAIWNKREGSWLHLFGALVIIVAIIHDILFLTDPLRYHGFGRPVVPLGITVMVLIEAVALARRFTGAFRTIETMTDKLLKMDKQKDEFLANTSHELKTPLHGIMNLSQSVMNEAEGSLTQVQRDNLATVVSVARRLSNLINDIMDFSRLRNSEVSLDRRQVNVKAVLTANLQVFHHYIGTKPIRLDIRLADGLPLVYADENRLLQIFYNLIGNSIKFTAAGEVTVTAETDGEMVRFFVSDTGIGIEEDKQEIIFCSFEQVGTAVAKEYGGAGLGLGITKRLIELHDGSIEVSSILGQGSTFSFTMPIGKEQTEHATDYRNTPSLIGTIELSAELAAATAEHGPVTNAQFTVLAVDDDPVNLRVILSALAIEPYRVLVARSGEEALKLLEQRPRVDLVILDVMMPGLSGYDTCRIIRQKYSLTDLPVLLSTVKNEQEDLLNGFAAMANDFLPKPFNTYELQVRVRTLLHMKRSAEEAVDSEIAFLQAQIKPHFLYNALNTIVSFSLDDPKTTYRLLIKLSRYLRSSFDFNHVDKLVPLSKELELTESYLDIEKARFGDRLRVVYAIDADADCMLPPLVLQPIVENAVRHGIMKRKKGGTVGISVRQEERFVIVTVEDDGMGMPQPLLQALFADKDGQGGVGLRNIQTRMLRMYGYGLEMDSKEDQGTKVTMRFPDGS